MSRLHQEAGDRRRTRRSSLLAALGDGVAATALSLLVAGVTRDPLAVASVFAAQQVPWAVVAVIGRGGWPTADRRTVLGSGITLRAVVVAVVGLLALAGAATLPVLAILALALGLGEALADRVERDAASVEGGPFGGATSRDALILGVGFPLGGLVYEMAAALPFLLDVGVFALAALAALSLSAPPSGPAAGPQAAPLRRGPAQASVLAFPALPSGTQAVTVVVSLAAATGGAVLGVLVLFALDDLALGAPAFGLLLAGLAGASTFGAWAAPSLAGLVGLRTALAAALVVAGVGYAGAGLVAQSPRPLAGALALGVGVGGSMAAGVLGRALLHLGAGRPLEASGLAAFHARVWGSVALGALVGGVVARSLGVVGAVIASGLVLVVLGAASLVVVTGRAPFPATILRKEKIG